jgi:hypothetical protein
LRAVDGRKYDILAARKVGGVHHLLPVPLRNSLFKHSECFMVFAESPVCRVSSVIEPRRRHKDWKLLKLSISATC